MPGASPALVEEFALSPTEEVEGVIGDPVGEVSPLLHPRAKELQIGPAVCRSHHQLTAQDDLGRAQPGPGGSVGEYREEFGCGRAEPSERGWTKPPGDGAREVSANRQSAPACFGTDNLLPSLAAPRS